MVPSTRSGVRRDVKLAARLEKLRAGLWFVPTLFVTLAAALAAIMNRVERSVDTQGLGVLAYGGEAGSAQDLLSTIASSTLTLAGVVFSSTIVALVLASGQFSPRLLRTFLRDRGNQVSLGTFLATFIYALLVLRTVRVGTDSSEAFVPGLSITVAIIASLASLGLFVYFVDHIAQSLRVVSVIESVAEETRAAIEANHPDGRLGEDDRPQVDAGPEAPPDVVICSTKAGVLVGIDLDDLVMLACTHDCRLQLIPRIGDWVPQGYPLVHVWGGTDLDEVALRSHLRLAAERTMNQDVAFGFRQLVDIGEKALSSSLNDPTTAVQALDRIHDLLRRLANRPFPDGQHRDEGATVRLIHPVATWEDYVALGFDEIRQYGADSLQVHRRLQATIEDLLNVTPAGRMPILRQQQGLLDALAERTFPDEYDRRSAGCSDSQGMGG